MVQNWEVNNICWNHLYWPARNTGSVWISGKIQNSEFYFFEIFRKLKSFKFSTLEYKKARRKSTITCNFHHFPPTLKTFTGFWVKLQKLQCSEKFDLNFSPVFAPTDLKIDIPIQFAVENQNIKKKSAKIETFCKSVRSVSHYYKECLLSFNFKKKWRIGIHS